MEISPIIIWNALLTLVYAPLIYGIRANHNELKRVDILLNKTREEIAIKYVSKIDAEKNMDRLLDRFDKLEDKLDTILMDDTEIIREGREAEEILESSFKKAFSNYKAELLDNWESTPAKDHELRESIYQAIKLLPK